MVKVALSGEGWPEQVATLERAAGRGYVRLLRSDLDRRAVLLEDLGPSLATRGRSVPDQLRCLADTLALAWQDPRLRAEPVEAPAGSGQDKATGLARLIRDAWDRLDRPCSSRVVDQALDYAERRAAEADRRPGRRPRRPASGQPAGGPGAATRRRHRLRLRRPRRLRRRPGVRPRRGPAGLVEHAARAGRPDGGRGLLHRARRAHRGGRRSGSGSGGSSSGSPPGCTCSTWSAPPTGWPGRSSTRPNDSWTDLRSSGQTVGCRYARSCATEARTPSWRCWP